MDQQLEALDTEYVSTEVHRRGSRRIRVGARSALGLAIVVELILSFVASGQVRERRTLASVAPPRPGTYHRQSVSTTRSKPSRGTTTPPPRTSEISERIEWLSREPGLTRVRVARGSASETHLWKAGGVYRDPQPVEMSVGPVASRCTPEPDYLVHPLPLRVGQSWETDLTCRTDVPILGQVTTRFHTVSRVTGTQRLTVGGRSVATFVISSAESGRASAEPTADGSGLSMELSGTATSYYSPAISLTVRTVSTDRMSVRSTTGGLTSDMETTTERTSSLLSTRPD